MDIKDEWNEGVTHPLQSWEWGEFRAKRQPVSRIEGFLIVWTKVPYTPFTFGYIPMGRAPNEIEIEKIREEGRKMRAIGIRIEPNLKRGELTNFQFSIFNKFFKPGRHLFKPKTLLLDLTKSEEELLANMHPKGRYNIKVAQRYGVKAHEDSSSSKAFDVYLKLMFEGTAKRQKIYAHSGDYHRQMWNVLRPAGIAHLFTAKYKDRIIALAMIFKFKETAYYAYGASALEHKEVMAPTLLLWEAIRWSKQSGCTVFDLWGAEGGKGFSRFKEQFGGQPVKLAGTFDLPVDLLLYLLFRAAEAARWKILRIFK
ncbi:MAG: FemAB family protein [Candidatus Amesbacteria bacterium GW2011_GWB1_47_19]|nr:MAG: FemAB family protein [Candidatus Amesbacteria bacterium GW2011_GWA1_44_24]KKU32072.1 MAG: femAB family protein [Candidatus Amesbacteria bacterium GW2011_GWC1_46_24]KKU67756.1 MAG: FemAB family protein [Candidatus Amesbacteria bacterium GW2011_GWB1_47_19]OGD06059.1 MAG: hypothetical protein A2379_03125 [Candidatus Amesbacteria bacterium RIFOXYB1_FULL_47_13]HBC72351.1 hypothetical protein [Candidatus Amesbacteria bacterium]